MGASVATYALYQKVLTQKDFVAVVKRISVLVTKKSELASLNNPWGLRGNVCDSSLARWKARSRLPIGYN